MKLDDLNVSLDRDGTLVVYVYRRTTVSFCGVNLPGPSFPSVLWNERGWVTAESRHEKSYLWSKTRKEREKGDE